MARRLPVKALATAAFLALLGGCGPAPAPVPSGPPDPARGKTAMVRYGCAVCHEIPGVVHRGLKTNAGPSLAHFSQRPVLAGNLPNTPDNVARWIRKPQEILPRTAMPALGVSEADARDIAAYLETLQ